MKLKLVLFILVMYSVLAVTGQEDDTKQLFDLAGRSKQWFEGFQQNVGKNEFSYHSFRNDVSESLITRCTDGKMAIEWKTAVVPENWSENTAGFLWIAAFDLAIERNIFDVFINGKKRFEIPSTTKKNWTISTNDGGSISFTTVETDQNGDAHGYMSMVIPESWLTKGEGQVLKIVGRANDSNAWLIVYQAKDALQYLQKSIEYDVWMELVFEQKDSQLNGEIKAPIHLAGKKLTYTYGEIKGTTELRENGNVATGTITLPASAINTSFEMNDTNGEIFIVGSLGAEFKSTRLLAKAVLLNECTIDGEEIQLSAQRNYKPKTVSSLLRLSESKLANGNIYLMNSSHQDIAWMDSPEKCVVERDTMLLTPLFEMAQKDPGYRFDIEDALMIKEFVERHPDKKELVKHLLNDGRISCGSTFIQPYEEMYSGESLARQFYFGAKWLKDEFGYNANVYWNEDVPGRTLQMMQLMRKAGTKYMMISRHERGLYNWYSPDGSYITAFSPGHYANAFTPLQKNFHEAAQYLAVSSLDWEKYYSEESKTPVIPLLSDWDMSPAKDYSPLIRQWENINELQNEKGNYIPAKLPEFNIASAPEFFDALTAENPELTNISGERPAVWLYIHGPSHQKAMKASREGDILLTQAEKFATANAMVDGTFINYPTARLNAAWESKIYPDHGWGGKNGDITDAYFHQKYEFARSEAEKIIVESLNDLAAKIRTDHKNGRPLVVFNSMNQRRSDPVMIEVSFKKTEAFSVIIKDEKGTTISNQLENIERYDDGSIKRADLHFVAEGIPSIGYKTYYTQPSIRKPAVAENEVGSMTENRFYRITFADGGLSSIFDKELEKELIDPGKFVAGEIFTMRSEGNGAGEFADIQQPDMYGFDKTGNYKTTWSIETDGPVFTVYKYRQKLRNAVVEQHVKLYHSLKKIDFDVALLNWEGELYREFRMAVPLNMTDGQVAYEVPFGVVKVGKDELEGAAGERYTTPCKDFHPRGIENWIGSDNSEFGVTMSSTVAAADWVDPTDNPVPNQILQPILLASRKSCHWEGNEYLQTGNHYFTFSITSHQPGCMNGSNFGRASNEKLLAVWADNTFTTAVLPETQSFFNIDREGVLISTVKKAEDSDEIVMRVTDLEGIDKTLEITCFKKIEGASLTNLIEENMKDLSVKNGKLILDLGHHSVETLKFN